MDVNVAACRGINVLQAFKQTQGGSSIVLVLEERRRRRICSKPFKWRPVRSLRKNST